MMVPEDPQGRIYDNDEVAAILKAAAELDQSATAPSSPAGAGLTLPEIHQIASEVGISRASIESASLVVAAPKDSPLSHRVQRVHRVAGAIPAERWDAVADDLRGVVGARGTVRLKGDGLEIELPKSDLGAVQIVVRSVAGATTIALWSETSKAREAGLTGSLLGLLGTAGLAANAPGAAVLAAAGIAGMGAMFAAGGGVGLGVGLGLWRWGAGRWRRRLARLLADITAQVDAAVEPPGPDAG